MNGRLVFIGRVFAFIAGAAVAGCGGAAPLASPNAIPAGGASWGNPNAKAQSLLYVSDVGANDVAYYTYPGGTLEGKLTGFGSVAGLCSDKAGDVWVVDEAGPVVMYKHGATSPTRKLTTAGAPFGCAVDPLTGNLAVTNGSSYLYGVISIYPKANGSPKVYYDSSVIDATYYCGYDPKGNLYMNGWNRSGQFVFIELPKGGSKFAVTDLNLSPNTPGGVQWDGKYVAVGNRGGGKVYRVTGSTGKIAQTITLNGGTNVQQFWIDGSTLIGPSAAGGGPVGYWKYPAGGSTTKTISGLTYPIGATVSAAK